MVDQTDDVTAGLPHYTDGTPVRIGDAVCVFVDDDGPGFEVVTGLATTSGGPRIVTRSGLFGGTFRRPATALELSRALLVVLSGDTPNVWQGIAYARAILALLDNDEDDDEEGEDR